MSSFEKIKAESLRESEFKMINCEHNTNYQNIALIPSVIEKEGGVSRVSDIFSRLLSSRVVFLCAPIDAVVASTIIAQLLHLQAEDNKAPISFYIDSPGGDAEDAMAIIDTMNFISCPVHTVCVGMCASAAALILACGEKGERIALPHSKVLIHQPLIMRTGGQQSDIDIVANNLRRCRDEIEELLSEATGKSIKQIHKDTERDNELTAIEAKDYGLIDKIA
ncbi:MAG: ATP-dependent Clp protease proteolytic subunit [Coriobacteriales bacterium]|nr:ATP-dependent Clp protease proteolytic subunit [Coriobacteriales bacterium]